MKFYKLSNGCIINLDTIATITKPIKKDPYNKTFGESYTIILTSGCTHECYDSVSNPSALMGASVLKYSELMELIKFGEKG